jgi:ABC-type amino acid transport substrate-binding protein
MAVSKATVVGGVLIALVVGVVAGYFVGDYLGYERGRELGVTWDSIVESGEIRVASSPDWPPFESLDPVTGEFVGFEVDIMEEAMRRLSEEEDVTITVEWVSTPFASIKEAIVAKTVDLGVSGFSITPARLEEVQFTCPHLITDAQVLALNSTVTNEMIPMGYIEGEGMESLAELKTYGLSCGVESGTTQEEELLAAGVTTVSLVDYWAAMDEMVDGTVDTVYAESPVSYYWIDDYANQTPPIGMQIIFTRPYWPVGFMAHKGSDLLVEKISGVIAKLSEEGWIDEKVTEYGMRFPKE